MAHAGGRPSIYTQELASKLCDSIAGWTGSLDRLCKERDDLPEKCVVYQWRDKNPEFAEMYWEAKRRQANSLADDIDRRQELIENLADAGDYDTHVNDKGFVETNVEAIQRSKLRVDTQVEIIKQKRWQMARLEPKRWGDKQSVEVTQISVEQQLERLK